MSTAVLDLKRGSALDRRAKVYHEVRGLFIFPVQMVRNIKGSPAPIIHELSFRHTASEVLLWEPARSDISEEELCAFVHKGPAP